MSILLKSLVKIGIPVVLTAAAYAAAKLHEQYAPKKERPHGEQPIIVAMGDSITFGSGVAQTRESDTWEVKLENLFGGAYQVLNYGISGATLQNEGDVPYWKMTSRPLQGFPEAALALNPEIVLLMLGTNDSKPYNWNHERYEAQLDERVKQIKAASCVKHLILMCPPFACPANGEDKVRFDISGEVIRDEIVPIVKKCAAENDLLCIDLYALTEGHPEYFADGVHPNSFGNRVIARHIHETLSLFL